MKKTRKRKTTKLKVLKLFPKMEEQYRKSNLDRMVYKPHKLGNLNIFDKKDDNASS